MDKLKRRGFLKKGTLAAVAGSAGLIAACSEKKKEESININFNKKFRWKMVTTWSPNFPVLGEGCKLVSKWINEMSGGRMEIDVYGGGELVPALEVFDAVSSGAVEMGSGSAYYWAGKIPAAQFFSSVPFGMNAQQMNAWVISGGGNDLWDEVYEPFGLIGMPGGNTGVQAGGWFNKEINSIEDLQGLKMRIPGLGAKILQKAGGTPMLVAGGELFTNLERGVLDATEWIGPYHDYKMGFHKVAQYYYYPGRHEPGTILEIMFNKEKFEKLPKDLQAIVKTACYRLNHWMLSEFEAKNSIYLSKLVEEEKVDIRQFPEEVMRKLKSLSDEVIAELIESDPLSKRVYEHFDGFRQQIKGWSKMSEKVYYEVF
ncbi:MAG: TRAP transporter substrate-binding protein [Cyclobacteriaceae bacterium]|nr:TRAP transporter substrate-binding protein [Cyclobacteriaceae bacterium]